MLAEKCRALRLIRNMRNNSQFVEMTRYFSLHDDFARFSVCRRKRPKPESTKKAHRNPRCDKEIPLTRSTTTRVRVAQARVQGAVEARWKDSWLMGGIA
jgi:hypothetical protein